MPILVIGYIIAYIDRVNVSFAKLQMLGDLKFSDSVYGVGAGIFFLGYFAFEIPSNIMLHKVGARVWICRDNADCVTNRSCAARVNER